MKKTKRLIFACLFVIPVIALLSGCAKDSDEKNTETLSLEEIVEKLYKNVDIPPYETIPLNSENFEYYAFVPYEETLSAVAADALVNITPHSVVVIHSQKDNGDDLAKQIIKNADPNKWLCVGSETVRVAYTDHYIVLIMSYEDTADAIVDNFKNMTDELDDMTATVLITNNNRYDPLL